MAFDWLNEPLPYIGIPTYMAVIIGFIIFILFLLLSRKNMAKRTSFKPVIMKKEIRKRYNKEFSYFGRKFGKLIYEAGNDKPFGYVIGYMLVMWVEQLKRYEPLHQNYSKELLFDKVLKCAQEVYQKDYKDLDDIQKKNISALAKEELRSSMTDEVLSSEEIRTGKKVILENNPIPMYMFKITHTDLLHRIISSFTNLGVDYFLFDSNQIEITSEQINLLSSLDKRQFNGVFIFNKSGKKLIEDVGYAYEREQVLNAVANQVPKTLHFDEQYGGSVLLKREDSKLIDERYKHQKEANE